MLTDAPDRIFKILVAKEQAGSQRIRELVELAKTAGRPYTLVPRVKLDTMAFGKIPHQGIIAMASPKPLWDLADLINHLNTLPPETLPLLLALDQITDPHNFGALIRTATAAGVTALVIPKVKSAGFSPEVSRASAGTLTKMNIAMVPNLAEAVKRLKDTGIWWVGAVADPKATAYDQYDFKGPTGLVLGSEAEGIRRLVREQCDTLVTIPLSSQVESLNVSVAGAVLLFEAQRQRRQTKQISPR